MHNNPVIKAIMNRKSTRKFSDQEIRNEDIHTILKAAMSGPSCVNARDWSFIVVKEKQMLEKMADANGRPAMPLRGAKLGILICGDLERACSSAKEFWIVDGAIAGQNITIAAEALGIGSVWLGTWPYMEKIQNQAKLFSLPETVIPHSIIALGYSDGEQPSHKDKPEWEESRLHFEKW